MNLGSKKAQEGRCFCEWRENGDWSGGEGGWGEEGETMGKAPRPKSSWRESEKLETAAGTKLKRERRERRTEGV